MQKLDAKAAKAAGAAGQAVAQLMVARERMYSARAARATAQEHVTVLESLLRTAEEGGTTAAAITAALSDAQTRLTKAGSLFVAATAEHTERFDASIKAGEAADAAAEAAADAFAAESDDGMEEDEDEEEDEAGDDSSDGDKDEAAEAEAVSSEKGGDGSR